MAGVPLFGSCSTGAHCWPSHARRIRERSDSIITQTNDYFMNYKRILVGIDFSTESARALREAVRLASYDGALVHALHIVDCRVLENLQNQVVVDKERTLSETRRRLDDFVDQHGAGYDDITKETVLGHPFSNLVDAVNEGHADLLVIGCRGTTNDPHRLGAVASKCLRKVPAPVLLIEEKVSEPFTRVVCAVDYSETSKAAIEQAIHLANLEQADIDFVHVYTPPSSFQSPESGVMLVGFEGIADYPKVVRENLEKFVEPYRSSIESKKVGFHVVDHMSVGRGITEHLRNEGGDLLVLGTHGRTGWRSLLLGTTAEHIFHKVPCSTLAVKPSDFTYKIPTI